MPRISPELTIVQVSVNFHSVLINSGISVEGRALTEVMDEFLGAEDKLYCILRGTLPSFHLERVARDQKDGSIRYLTFQVLPLNEYEPSAGLLLLVENATSFGQIGQSLIQSRNELMLTKDALARAYEELQQLAVADRKLSEEALQSAYQNFREAYDRTIEGWVHALDLRHRGTESHALHVTDMTIKLARAMGIAKSEIKHIRRGALLHNIGKMAIPDSILFKVGKLTNEEWAIIQKHPLYAKEMLSPITYLQPAIDIPLFHHEKWDGSGYPNGLQGEQIPLAARLFAVVDVWDALRSDRAYRQGWSEEEVREYIRGHAGTHFDPSVVDLFLRAVDEMIIGEDLESITGVFQYGNGFFAQCRIAGHGMDHFEGTLDAHAVAGHSVRIDRDYSFHHLRS